MIMCLDEEDDRKQEFLHKLNSAIISLSFPAFTPTQQTMYGAGWVPGTIRLHNSIIICLIFSKILRVDILYLTCKGEIWCVFCKFDPCLYHAVCVVTGPTLTDSLIAWLPWKLAMDEWLHHMRIRLLIHGFVSQVWHPVWGSGPHGGAVSIHSHRPRDPRRPGGGTPRWDK